MPVIILDVAVRKLFYMSFYLSFQIPCESGGIGRRARLRGVWVKPYGFKSRLSHQRMMLFCIHKSYPKEGTVLRFLLFLDFANKSADSGRIGSDMIIIRKKAV